jgi:transposase
MHTYRYVYNKTLAAVKINKHPLNRMSLRNKFVTDSTRTTHSLYSWFSKTTKSLEDIGLDPEIRKLIFKAQMNLPSTKSKFISPWELETPKTIRQQAVFEMVQAYKTNLDLFHKGEKPYFNMSFKVRKEMRSHTFRFDDKNSWDLTPNSLRLFRGFNWNPHFRISKRDSLRFRTLYENNCLSDSGGITYKDGRWFFIVSETRVCPTKTTTPKKAIALDPGVREFLTGYSSEKLVTYSQPRAELVKLRNEINVFRNLDTCNRSNKKRGLRKRERRIRNLVDETHWQVINHLLSNWDAVYMGDIKSQDILSKSCLRGSTKNELQSLSFYRFKCRLIAKAEERKKLVIMTNEAYTTKTCTFCGHRYEIGASKTYACTECDVSYDRDEGAARNIFMKTILG